MIKTAIFDLDGTIADSMRIGAEVINQITEGDGTPKLDVENMENYRGMHFKDVVKLLDAPRWKYPWYAWRFKRLLHRRINEVLPFEGMKAVFEELSKAGIQLGVLTSNSKKNVQQFLKNHDMYEYFDFVDSEWNVFGKDKALERLIAKHEIDREYLIYVGDEVRDVEACKRIDIPIIAVAWGYNNAAFLAEYKPDYIVQKPEGIVEIVL